MAQQFAAQVYQSTFTGDIPGTGNNPGGLIKVATPVYQQFASSQIQIHSKTAFKRFFQGSNQNVDPAYWEAINSVVQNTETGMLYASPYPVSLLVTLANA